MKAAIKKDAQHIYMKKFAIGRGIPNRQFADALGKIQGRTLEVKTDHLFISSVNAIYEDGVIGIDEEYIDKIIDDARSGKAMCRWCGKMVSDPACDVCEHCNME